MINELSIIIPTLNEAVYLPELLKSLVKQTYTGKLQVIVVDGNSDDETRKIARLFSSRIKELEVIKTDRNIGHQRNVGARHAKYRYLLFIDADVVLPQDILKELLAKVNLTGKFVVGTMHTVANMNLIDRFFLVFVYGLLFSSWAAKVPAINGDFILTTRENHRSVNGFVEGALVGEDIDYSVRSVKAGAKYKYFLKPKIVASDRRLREVGRWRLLLLWSRGYLRVLRGGPVFPGEGFEYEFGHYGDKTIAKK